MTDFSSTFASLSKMLRKHAAGMSIKTDEPGNFYIRASCSHTQGQAKVLWGRAGKEVLRQLSPDASV